MTRITISPIRDSILRQKSHRLLPIDGREERMYIRLDEINDEFIRQASSLKLIVRKAVGSANV